MLYLSLIQFKKLFPNCKNPDLWVNAMKKTFAKTSINSIKRQSAFIAQCGHESGGFRVFSENLNYSSNALQAIFGKYFKDKDSADYHRQPEKIANVVYANRMGNNNSGDGYKYRGRGPIQLTGKNNYSKFQLYLTKENYDFNIIDNPDLLVSNIEISLLSAIWFWESNNLNKYSDSLNIKTLTKRINGGYNGLEDRKRHYYELMSKMTGLVRLGSKGEKVEILQQLLSIQVDGIFGSNTEKFLKFKQAELNLVPDGICGQKTFLKLFQLIG